MALFFIAGAAAAEEKDVRIVQSDAQGLLVEFIPAYTAPETLSIGGTTYLRYGFQWSVPRAGSVPGLPDLPERATTVSLGGVRGNSATVVTAEYEELSGVLQAPLPGAEEKDGEILERLAADPDAYAQNEFAPAEVASLRRVAETQGAVLGELSFSPLQYNPARKLLRRYSRIIVRVSFGPALAVKAPRGTMSSGLALNAAAVRSTGGSAVLTHSVLAAGSWFRFTVSEDGIYRLTGQALLAAGIPSTVDPSTIRIYGNGGFETPMDASDPVTDDLAENAVAVRDNGTAGNLDASDEILFYGKGTRGWTYQPQNRSFYHYINHFSESSVYYLTYGGAAKAMVQVPSGTGVGAYAPSSVVEKIFREDEKTNLLNSGLDWLGQSFGAGDQLTLVHPLPGLDATSPIRYRLHLGAQSFTSSSFTVYEHGAFVGSIGLSGTVVGDYGAVQLRDGIIDRSVLPAFTEPQSQLRLAFSTSSSTGKGFLDWLEIYYRRNLSAQGDQFRFHAADTAAALEYAVSGFASGAVRIFDVSRYDSVVEILPKRVAGDTVVVQFDGAAGTARDILMAGPSAFKTPGALVAVANQDLHGDPTEAENIIVTHPEFLPAALRLKAHRERPGSESLRTIVVTTDQIYNEFGGGIASPSAIRNYLRYRYSNQAASPKYALLFGDGDFDYKRILGKGPNWVPPWESDESYNPLSTLASDDQFVVFNTAGRVNMGLGRLTARSAGEAGAIVDKIVDYETGAVRDPWKLRVTFVADDALAAPGEDNGFAHVDHAEAVAAYVPALFEQRKIYLHSYPTVVSAGGRRKPAVNEAVREQINEGTVILNYSGHGNPRLWAHENVFVRETDFPLLKNPGRYFFLVAATCNYSEFDDLSEQSGGELLVSMPEAGAVGVFSATRVVFAYENRLLNEVLFRNTFPVNAMGAVPPQRLGDIVYKTKQTRTTSNDLKYFLLGDPATMIGFPKLTASIDSVNGIPTSQIAQLRALAHATVNASVRDSLSAPPRAFDGEAQLVVYDADQTAQLVDPRSGTRTYSVDGSVLFRGSQSVAGGAINAEFVVPKDISYGNGQGRIVSYFWNGQEDGAGYTTNVRVGGTDSLALADTKGPGIQLYLDSRSFRAGDLVGSTPTLIAELADSSGINTSGAGIGHRLEAWLDGGAESIDLTNFYKSKKDSYREGTVEYRLPAQTEGTHRLRLRAWDTYNNASVEETVFDVGTSMGLRLSNVLNYPNPFTSSTLFTFEQNQVSGIDAEIRIYTVAGRLIQTLSAENQTDERIQIPWDGRDRDGDALANGVYLYKVTARTHDGRYTSEVLGKLSILR